MSDTLLINGHDIIQIVRKVCPSARFLRHTLEMNGATDIQGEIFFHALGTDTMSSMWDRLAEELRSAGIPQTVTIRIDTDWIAKGWDDNRRVVSEHEPRPPRRNAGT